MSKRYTDEDWPGIEACMTAARGLSAYEVTKAMRKLQPGVNYAGCGKGSTFHSLLSGQYGKKLTVEQITTRLKEVRGG